MKKISINDMAFGPDLSMSKYSIPKFFEWDRSCQDTSLVFFTDACFDMAKMKKYNSSKKIAIVLEPHVIMPQSYDYILQNSDAFNFVLTHHTELIKASKNPEKFLYFPNVMFWIGENDRKIYPKSKNICTMASDKMYAPGHQMRHQIIKFMKSTLDTSTMLDVYGKGYFPFPHKVDVLKDYRFSIEVENCQANHYFSEKLLDCFATGTVPIYWGPPEIDKFFNPKGIIRVVDHSDCADIIRILDKEGQSYYDNCKVAIEENYQISQQYGSIEDYIWTEILKPHELV